MAEQERLSNDEFLDRLSELLKSASTKSKASIYLTQKRLSGISDDDTKSDLRSDSLLDYADISPPTHLPVLIRATNGKSKKDRKDKIKIATVVQPDELESFFGKYAELCRTGMSGLKKRDRSKGKKKKKVKA
ncbi:signal recognition particle, SRP9/SRP14 subunit [Microthyrium microscopicum]|uniref:Signal recognition particle subunit SRP14 n=1 Tax=Microthyrium microscopicum TaxID=703497 RepID=A0A6A6TXK7_9PEZI|nr:signal recognition particle, SRP9/SRP14 subunit [Microthyrium microscopicum]